MLFVFVFTAQRCFFVPKEDVVRIDATVLDVLPNGICKVKLDNDEGTIITAYLRGIFERNKIKVYKGDKVGVEISVFDHNCEKGRVYMKYRNEANGNRNPNAKRSFSSRKIRDRRH